MRSPVRFDTVCVESKALESARRWIRALHIQSLPWRVAPFPHRPQRPASVRTWFARGKRTLWLRCQRGAWLRPFTPATPYGPARPVWVLDLGEGCPMDCVYCVLQSYLSHPYQVVYVNLDDLVQALDAFHPDEPALLATGIYVDSMVVFHLLNLWPVLVPWLERHPHVELELRSKAPADPTVWPPRPLPNVLFGWSLTPSPWDRSWELLTAPVEDRIAGLSEAVARGFRVAVHLDPIVCEPGWQTAYEAMLERLAAHVSPDGVAYVSIGSLRFDADLRAISSVRFPRRPYWTGPFTPSRDGLYRYAWPLRRAVYRFLTERLRAWVPQVPIFYAMEPLLTSSPTSRTVQPS